MTILITGASQRIGLHLAKTFLQRGQAVIGTWRSERPGLDELRSLGAELLRCDLEQLPEIEALIARVRERHQSLRAIIHNASAWLGEAESEAPADLLQQMLAVHVRAPYLLNLGLAPLLDAWPESPADIIHIGDYVSSRGSRRHIAYAASKAAQDNLTLSFAARLAPKVKVNSIAPSLVLFRDTDDPAYREAALGKSLLQREAGLAEMQHQVDYLMHSQFVTGRILHVDGGRHLA